MKLQTILVVSLVLGVVILAIYFVYYELKCKKARNMILAILTTKWVRGRDLRQTLARNGIHLSSGSFYIVMNHLVEERKVIERDTINACDRIREFRLPLTVEEHNDESVSHDSNIGHVVEPLKKTTKIPFMASAK